VRAEEQGLAKGGPRITSRAQLRDWLASHPHPSGRELAEAGLVVPHWPPPFGLGADAPLQLAIEEELAEAGVSLPSNPIGIGWAAPTIWLAGTPAQRDRYIWPALSGEEVWCQLFSEPDAGSDLASLRTVAQKDGDCWVVDGTKVWSSGAHRAQLAILLARTDPQAPKRRGISYFICPMDSPGVQVLPIVDMTGAHSFNLVHLDQVRLAQDCLVGKEGQGWDLARVTLANERVSLSTGGVLWGSGPRAADLVGLLRRQGGVLDPVLRQEVVKVWVQGELLELMRQRVVSARLAGRAPGAEASTLKLLADEHGQAVMALAKAVAGSAGMLEGSGPQGPLAGRASHGPTPIPPGTGRLHGVESIWHHGFVFSPALTIGGGTAAIQRNIVAEAVLGLPRQPAQAGLGAR